MLKTLASAADKAEILGRLATVRSDSERRWGRMNAHQMICHLSDGYRMLTDGRSAGLAKVPLPRPIIKMIVLYAPIKWRSGLPTTPELDQERRGTPPMEFARDLAELVRLIEQITADAGAGRDCPRHPAFGRMSASDWMRWAYLHADHHLRQFGV
jgi:hypothetical protein